MKCDQVNSQFSFLNKLFNLSKALHFPHKFKIWVDNPRTKPQHYYKDCPMSWFLLITLLYILVGALLVERTMRGAKIHATFAEWIVMLLFWPLCLKVFVHIAMMQSQFEAIEVWAELELKKKHDKQ